MALPSFNNSTPVTAAYLNALPDALPRSCVLAAGSYDTVATSNSVNTAEIARVKMRPVMGNYLHVAYEHKASGFSPNVTTRTALIWRGQTLGQSDATTTSGTYSTVSRSINMASVDGNDLTAEDVDLVFYAFTTAGVSPIASVRFIRVASSDSSSAADSML